MIKKLQWKFIRIAAFSLLAVIVALVAAINISNWYQTNQELEITLERIYQNDGRLPNSFRFPDEPRENFPDDEFSEFEPPDENMKFRDGDIPVSSPYFVVELNANMEISNTFIDSIDSSSLRTVAEEYAVQILATNTNDGWFNDYRFRLYEYRDGYMLVVVDASASNYSNWSLLGITAMIALVSFLVVLLLIILLSKRAIAPLAESYRKQQQFITDAGHELKTPLTIISANTEILRMNYGNDDWLNGIANQAERMQKLVNHLIPLARMDEEENRVMMERFSISDAIVDTAAAFEGLANRENKKFILDIAPALEYVGDEAAIRQLTALLIDNAVKYCDAGGEISVRLRGGKHLSLSVGNTYAEADQLPLDRLFDRFYRADSARTSNGSYGLGLSIAKSIVERHRGTLRVQSVNGSVIFTVRLS